MSSFKVGQVWTYRTRPGEEASRLYIARVDNLPNLTAFHISVDGLRLKNPHSAAGYQTVLPHAPVDEETLKASVVSLAAENAPMPDISEGYGHWREAYDSGQGGVFNIPVAKIIEYIESIVAKGHRDA